MVKKILCIGDTHMPWLSKKSFEKVLLIIDALKPDAIIQMGDLYDMYSFSRFAKSLDIYTPKQEILEGRLQADNFWKLIRKKAPRATSHYQLLGNHDSRPLDRIAEKYPEIKSLVDVKHLWEFDGVKTVHDVREELVLKHITQGEIVFMHGYRSKLGDHMKYNFNTNTVCGHSHRGGVYYEQMHDGRVVWELNCGYLGSEEEIGNYRKQRFSKWTLGLGVIDELGPRFIPFNK